MTSEQVEQLRCWLPELVAARLTLGSVAILDVRCRFWSPDQDFFTEAWMSEPDSPWLCDRIEVDKNGETYAWWIAFEYVATVEGLSIHRWAE